jgi:hypothetical protein
MGLEPTTLLHGKQKLSFRKAQESPANRQVSDDCAKARCPGITGDTRGFSKPMANRLRSFDRAQAASRVNAVTSGDLRILGLAQGEHAHGLVTD